MDLPTRIKMHGGKLTIREAEIIRQLLADRGIHAYEFVQTVNEGRDLPGSTAMSEIELLSATIATANTSYSFWLDWTEDQYILKHWHEIDLNSIRPHALKFKEKVLAAQKRVRERGKDALNEKV